MYAIPPLGQITSFDSTGMLSVESLYTYMCTLNTGDYMKVNEYLSLSKTERQRHINLSENCLERGGISTNHRGVLAEFLKTDIYTRPADLCHACHNGKCSNPKHLYWGTRRENIDDAKINGTFKSAWDRCVEKYGLEGAKELNKKNANPVKAGAGNKGKPKSAEHRKKISESLRFNKTALVDQLAESGDLKSP